MLRSLAGLLALAFSAFSLAGSPAGAARDDSPHIMVGTMDIDAPLIELARGILQDAYVAIGRVPHFVVSPPRRSLMLAGTGQIDAEMFRVRKVEQLFPDLVRVRFPIYQVQGMAYVRDASLPIRRCEDLAGHSVSVLQGIVIMEECARHAARVLSVRDLASQQKLLARGRVDVVLVERTQGQVLLDPQLPSGVTALPAPLFSVPIYHYVHKSRADLAGPLAEALQAQKRSGDLAARTMQWRLKMALAPQETAPDTGTTQLGQANPFRQ